MAKRVMFLMSLLTLNACLSAFEKLPPQYQITYGNQHAPIQAVEYFSLSCPKCLQSFKKDFPSLRKKYVNSHDVYWVFHPSPADLLTLQAMVCLEKLSEEEKRVFLEVVVENLEDPSEGCLIMQTAIKTLGKPLPQLAQLDYLKQTSAFTSAYQFLKQEDVIKELPTVEINGKVYDEFPNSKFLEKKFSLLMETRK